MSKCVYAYNYGKLTHVTGCCVLYLGQFTEHQVSVMSVTNKTSNLQL